MVSDPAHREPAAKRTRSVVSTSSGSSARVLGARKPALALQSAAAPPGASCTEFGASQVHN